MKALVTGGAGFIGSALGEILVSQGHEVVAVDNLRRNSLTYSQRLNTCDRFKLCTADVCDINSVLELGKDFDFVFHMAAIAGVSQYFRIPAEVMRTNTIGTVNVLELCKIQKSLKLFVDVSTSEVYGSNCYAAKETDDIKMENISERRWTYASSKIASERFAMAYMWEYDIPITIVRPFNVYGDRQTGEGAISNFVRKAVAGDNLVITGNGQQLRSFCYISDFLRGLMLLMDNAVNQNSKVIGEIFNIGSDHDVISMEYLSKLVIKLANSPSKVVFRPHEGADVMVRSPNIDKIRELGYNNNIKLEEGVMATINWERSRR